MHIECGEWHDAKPGKNNQRLTVLRNRHYGLRPVDDKPRQTLKTA
jgi:hypothetical protein